MLLQPIHQALTSFPHFPDDALPTPEIWRRNTRPAGWTDCLGPEVLFGEWLDRLCAEVVILSPALEAAYDKAIDAAFEKVMDRFCGPGRTGL